MAVAVKVGPWGAKVGQPVDIEKASKPQSLVKISVCSSESDDGRIFSFSFDYKDQNKTAIPVGPWGKIHPEYTVKEIIMERDEYLVKVTGTSDGTGITSLTLVTNKQGYPTYGHKAGDTFVVTLDNDAEVVAFFGSSGEETLTALGVYVVGKKGLPVKIGPWGGSADKKVDVPRGSTPVRLNSVTVYSTQSSGESIKGFSFIHVDQDDKLIHDGPWGTATGHPNPLFRLNPGEYVNNLSGTSDDYGVTSLKFTTNKQQMHGPYGSPSGTAFSVPLPNDRDDNGAVVAFFGLSGKTIVALGVYVGLASDEP